MRRAVSQPAPEAFVVADTDSPGAGSRKPSGLFILTRGLEILLLTLAACAILGTRVPHLPDTLEDIDSVNFDLGVHDFYPPRDQPHPPGYAVFIAVAKVVHPLFESHAAGLAFPSALFSALMLFPLYVLVRHLTGRLPAVLACILVVFNPLFWLNGVRPMSDVTGFALTLMAQCLLVLALGPAAALPRQRRLWLLGVAMAALSVGVRLQALVLVGPVLAWGFLRLAHLRLHTMAVFAVTCAVWLVPTVIASDGLELFLARQIEVFGEALPSEPLLSEMTMHRVYSGAIDMFVSPWSSPWLAVAPLLAAVAGLVLLWRTDRRTLGFVVLLFAPYALYHYLLQQAIALRYTIPILPLVAIPAALSLVRLVRSRPSGVFAVAALFACVSAGVTLPALSAYSARPSPPAHAIEYLQQLTGADETAPVVAGNFVFDRYLTDLAPSARIIRTRPHQEWRALNRFWVAGNLQPIWFLRDPSRSILRLKDPTAQSGVAAWRWPDPLLGLLKGARPGTIELVRLDPPRWFAESGFLLTSEAGPADRVAREQHLLFVRSDLAPLDLIVSGSAAHRTSVNVVVGGRTSGRWSVDQHFSVRVTIPHAPGADPYVPVRLDAHAPLLLTQISTAAHDDLVFPAAGFFGAERDERDQEFRWIGPKAAIAVAGSDGPLRIHVRGVVPVNHYRRPIVLSVRGSGGVDQTHQLAHREFAIAIDVPASGADTTLSFAASQSFVPHDVEFNGDRRRLALRIYELRAERLEAPRTLPAHSP